MYFYWSFQPYDKKLGLQLRGILLTQEMARMNGGAGGTGVVIWNNKRYKLSSEDKANTTKLATQACDFVKDTGGQVAAQTEIPIDREPQQQPLPQQQPQRQLRMDLFIERRSMIIIFISHYWF